MIRTLILAALVPLLRAQLPPVVATVATQPDGRITITVQNLRESPLTAYFFKQIAVGFGFMGYTDAGGPTNGNSPKPFPIPAYQQATTSLPTAPNSEVTFRAALWADGSSYGDPEWVGRLRERRVLAQQHNDNAIDLLQKALDSGEDAPMLVKQLQTMIDGITPLTVNSDDMAFLRSYYQTAIRRFGSPNGFAKSLVDGTPVHMTDGQIIEVALEGLQEQRARLQQYR